MRGKLFIFQMDNFVAELVSFERSRNNELPASVVLIESRGLQHVHAEYEVLLIQLMLDLIGKTQEATDLQIRVGVRTRTSSASIPGLLISRGFTIA